MKIVLIFIVQLGLVACANGPQDFKALRCKALDELQDYTFSTKADPKGAKISGMLDQFAGKGVLTKAETAGFKKNIPDFAKKGLLREIAADVKNLITSKTCQCSVNGIGGLNVSAGASGSNASAGEACLKSACLTCNAIDQILQYTISVKDDASGAEFWKLVAKFTDNDLITNCEYDRLRLTLHPSKVEVFRDGHFRNASMDVVKYLQAKSEANCCGKVGSNATAGNATKFKCELRTFNEKTAAQQLRIFIKKNDHSSEEIMTMVNNLYVQGLINGFEYEGYRYSVKEGDFKGKPKEFAEIVLEDILRNYALTRLNQYMEKDVNNDDRGIKLMALLKQLQNEGFMTEQDLQFCQMMHSGGGIYSNSLILARDIIENIFAKVDGICKRRS